MRRVVNDALYVPTLVEGAEAAQLADLLARRIAERRRMTVPALRL
jgi:hypothetical protein